MTNEEATDREALRALVTRLNVHGDRGRFEELAACFTEDGQLRWATGQGAGRTGIIAAIRQGASNPGVTRIRHHLTTMHFEVDGADMHAQGRIYFFVISNAGFDHAGLYLDRYIRAGGHWLITERDIRIEWQAPTSFYEPQLHR